MNLLKKKIVIVGFQILVVGLTLPMIAQQIEKEKAGDRALDEDPEFVEARSLFFSGQYMAAEQKFSAYLLAHPDHKPTKNFIKLIAQSRKYNPKNPSPVDKTREHLAAIRVDKIVFEGTEWSRVYEYLQNLANPKKDGKDPVNYISFIDMTPTGFKGKVTMNIRDMSLLDVIKRITEQLGMTYVIDTSAVIFELKETKK